MYEKAKIEPSIQEILNDPIIKMLMATDGVEESDVLPQVPDAESKMVDDTAVA